MADSPNGVYARIAVQDLRLSEAYEAVEDVSYWNQTMPAVLYHFNITLTDYEQLTVYQHRLLVEYLVAEGLVNAES